MPTNCRLIGFLALIASFAWFGTNPISAVSASPSSSQGKPATAPAPAALPPCRIQPGSDIATPLTEGPQPSFLQSRRKFVTVGHERLVVLYVEGVAVPQPEVDPVTKKVVVLADGRNVYNTAAANAKAHQEGYDLYKLYAEHDLKLTFQEQLNTSINSMALTNEQQDAWKELQSKLEGYYPTLFIPWPRSLGYQMRIHHVAEKVDNDCVITKSRTEHRMAQALAMEEEFFVTLRIRWMDTFLKVRERLLSAPAKSLWGTLKADLRNHDAKLWATNSQAKSEDWITRETLTKAEETRAKSKVKWAEDDAKIQDMIKAEEAKAAAGASASSTPSATTPTATNRPTSPVPNSTPAAAPVTSPSAGTSTSGSTTASASTSVSLGGSATASGGGGSNQPK